MNEISKSIINSKTFGKNDAIVLGFSGGPDSLCLLHALNNLKVQMNLTIIPIHINHMLRPGDCDLEQSHAEAICSSLGLSCKSIRVDCRAVALKHHISDEEAGRLIRYSVFSDVSTTLLKDGFERSHIKIAVAHNQDDQVETVLFRIMRGTGIHGLAGIPKIRGDKNGFKIIRPLLEVSRNEIEQYIESNKLEPNIDSSNDKPIYSRNKIRLELIPLLEDEYNSSIKAAVTRLAELANEDEDYFHKQAIEKLKSMRTDGAMRYKISEFARLHIAIKRRIVWELFRQLDDIEASYELINAVVSVAESGSPSARCNLPKGWVAERQYDELVFYIASDINNLQNDSIPVDLYKVKASVISREDYEIVKKHSLTDSDIKYAIFDFDMLLAAHGINKADVDTETFEILEEKISNENKMDETKAMPYLENTLHRFLKLRSRKPGDTINTRNGDKKIQDLLVDEKVPKSLRAGIKMVAFGNEILWVLPDENFKNNLYKKKGKYSQKYQISDKAERLLFLETQ